MQRPPQDSNRLLVLLVIAALAAGGWLWWQRTRAHDPVEQVAQFFAPDEAFDGRQNQVERAQDLVGRMNRGQRGDDAPR